MPVGTAIAGRPSTGTAISVADCAPDLHGSLRAFDVEAVRVRQLGAHRRQHQRRAREKRVPVADQPRALGERLQVRIDAPVRDVVEHEPHRQAHAVVAVAIEVGLHEATEFRNEHLEPQRRTRGETRAFCRRRPRNRRRPSAFAASASAAATGADGAAPPRSAASVTSATRIGACQGAPSSGTGTHHGSRASRCGHRLKSQRARRAPNAPADPAPTSTAPR